MALVRKQKNKGKTYQQFVDEMMESIIEHNPTSQRIDIVFDVYLDSSIKNAERVHRAVGKLQFKNIIGSQLIKQLGAFLSSSNNKKALIEYLVNEWDKYDVGDRIIYVAYEGICIKLMSNLTAENVPELSCDHEEADTRILLHANHMSQAGFGNIIIHTPDTDVFLIAIAASTEIQYVHTNRNKGKSPINLHSENKILLEETFP